MSHRNNDSSRSTNRGNSHRSHHPGNTSSSHPNNGGKRKLYPRMEQPQSYPNGVPEPEEHNNGGRNRRSYPQTQTYPRRQTITSSSSSTASSDAFLAALEAQRAQQKAEDDTKSLSLNHNTTTLISTTTTNSNDNVERSIPLLSSSSVSSIVYSSAQPPIRQPPLSIPGYVYDPVKNRHYKLTRGGTPLILSDGTVFSASSTTPSRIGNTLPLHHQTPPTGSSSIIRSTLKPIPNDHNDAVGPYYAFPVTTMMTNRLSFIRQREGMVGIRNSVDYEDILNNYSIGGREIQYASFTSWNDNDDDINGSSFYPDTDRSIGNFDILPSLQSSIPSSDNNDYSMDHMGSAHNRLRRNSNTNTNTNVNNNCASNLTSNNNESLLSLLLRTSLFTLVSSSTGLSTLMYRKQSIHTPYDGLYSSLHWGPHSSSSSRLCCATELGNGTRAGTLLIFNLGISSSTSHPPNISSTFSSSSSSTIPPSFMDKVTLSKGSLWCSAWLPSSNGSSTSFTSPRIFCGSSFDTAPCIYRITETGKLTKECSDNHSTTKRSDVFTASACQDSSYGTNDDTSNINTTLPSSLIFYGCRNGIVQAWDSREKQSHTVYRHSTSVAAIRNIYTSGLVLTADNDKSIVLHDPRMWTKPFRTRFTEYQNNLYRYDVTVSSTGTLIIAGNKDNNVRIWNMNGTLLRTYPIRTNFNNTTNHSSSSNVVTSGGTTGNIQQGLPHNNPPPTTIIVSQHIKGNDDGFYVKINSLTKDTYTLIEKQHTSFMFIPLLS